MRARRWSDWIGAVLPVLALLWIGCPTEDDDDAGDDDTYTGPAEATINLNVLGTVGGEDYTLLSIYAGGEVTSCGPSGGQFELISDAGLVDTDGQLSLQAGGWQEDLTVNPSQSLNAGEDGGTWQITIPEATGAPFEYDSGNCFLFVQSEPENCHDNPSIPFCGNFSCGTDETPMLNGSGDGVRITGTYNCYQ